MSDKDFPQGEFDHRWERAKELMREHTLDAILVTEAKNYRYFSGHRSRQFANKQRPMLFLLPLEGAPTLMVYGNELPEADGQTWIDDIRTYTDVPFPHELVTETITDLGLEDARIGAELGKRQRLWMSVLDWQRIERDLPEADFVDGSPVFERCRMVKSDREIKRLERACQITADAWERTRERLESGMTVGDATQIGIEAQIEAGSDISNPGFGAIDILNKGDQYQADDFFFYHFGADYRGYKSDIARLASFGDPSPKQEDLFEQIVDMQDAVIEAIEPYMPIKELGELCNTKLEKYGYPPLKGTKRIGHGIGLDFQEPPSMNLVEEQELLPGTVLTPEPRFVNDGEWVMVEENVVVTENGARTLSPDSYAELYRIDG